MDYCCACSGVLLAVRPEGANHQWRRVPPIRARQWKLISQGEDASRPRVSSLDTSIKRPTIVGLAVKPIESRVPEIGAFGLMSGDGKESVGLSPQATAPILNSTTAPFGDESEGVVRCWGRDAVVRGGAGSDGGS